MNENSQPPNLYRRMKTNDPKADDILLREEVLRPITTNETNEQIAQEAADEICDLYRISGYKLILPIILSAIEKSREAEIKKFLPMVEAEIAASQLQDWTPQSVGEFHLLLNDYQREEIAKHHNAALAAAKDWSPIAAENVRLTAALAAARQARHHDLEIDVAKANEWAEYERTQNAKLRQELAVERYDRKHCDAKIKPLVEALEQCERALAAFVPQHPAGPNARAVLDTIEKNEQLIMKGDPYREGDYPNTI